MNALVDAAILCARTLQAEVAQTITKERGGKTPSEAEVRRRVRGLYDYGPYSYGVNSYGPYSYGLVLPSEATVRRRSVFRGSMAQPAAVNGRRRPQPTPLRGCAVGKPQSRMCRSIFNVRFLMLLFVLGSGASLVFGDGTVRFGAGQGSSLVAAVCSAVGRRDESAREGRQPKTGTDKCARVQRGLGSSLMLRRSRLGSLLGYAAQTVC